MHNPEPLELIQRYNLNFIEGNIVKYVLRSPFKGDSTGDLQKAISYARILDPSTIPVRFPQFDCEKELQEYKELGIIEKTIISLVINGVKGESDKEVLIDYLGMSIRNEVKDDIAVAHGLNKLDAVDKRKNHNPPSLSKIKRFYLHGKFFDTFEEMRDYDKNWGDLSLDIDEFKRQMNLIIKCFENVSKKISPTFSNKDAYISLRYYTDWAVEDK